MSEFWCKENSLFGASLVSDIQFSLDLSREMVQS